MSIRATLARLAGGNPAPAAQHRDLVASLLVMAWMVEARDPYTGGHLWRVSRYAELLAEALGWQPADIARVAIGGFLHDLGKIGIPDAILTKRERLTDDEYDVIRTHPDIGARLLAGHPLAALVNDAVLFHHERPDGNGYPRKRSGGGRAGGPRHFRPLSEDIWQQRHHVVTRYPVPFCFASRSAAIDTRRTQGELRA